MQTFLKGGNAKFVMDSSGMFRGGPDGLTVSDPESGVFSTHELENMGCDDDDDEYSSKLGFYTRSVHIICFCWSCYSFVPV